MAINTSKKIKKISHNQVNIPSGADVSNVTATRNDVLPSKKFVDSNGNIHSGQMPIYTGVSSRTSNGTFSTANKYVTSDLTIRVDASHYIYRHLNPTIIRIDLRNVTMPYTMKLYIYQPSSGSRACYINWGDGADNSPTSVSSSFRDYKSHTYTTQGIHTIIITPQDQGDNRFLLDSSREEIDMMTFGTSGSTGIFGQTSSSHFTIPVSIYCGDSAWFKPYSLSYCDNIEVLDFTNMNSLMEQQVTSNTKYFTQDFLADNLCRNSIVWSLIIGSGINEFKSNCFRDTNVWNMVVIDARGTGISTTPITVGSQYTLPTVVGKILISHLRLDRYKSASYWSAKSSQMFGY